MYICVSISVCMQKLFLTCCFSNCSASVLVMLLQYHLTGNKANHQSFTWQFKPPTGEMCNLYSRIGLNSVFFRHVVAWYESFIPKRQEKKTSDARVQRKFKVIWQIMHVNNPPPIFLRWGSHWHNGCVRQTSQQTVDNYHTTFYKNIRLWYRCALRFKDVQFTRVHKH